MHECHGSLLPLKAPMERILKEKDDSRSSDGRARAKYCYDPMCLGTCCHNTIYSKICKLKLILKENKYYYTVFDELYISSSKPHVKYHFSTSMVKKINIATLSTMRGQYLGFILLDLHNL
jgi:hypothetical protein